MVKPLFIVLLTMSSIIAPANAASAPPDPGLWLEDVTGERALQWVRQQNQHSTGELANSDEFQGLQKRSLTILDSKERIPYLQKIGGRYYNFWRDAGHVRGIWRRTTFDEYRKAAPAWETVLDLDALGTAEKESWVWRGAQVLRPGNIRCLISLSRGGADAAVVREFDLGTKDFVAGFSLPESKSELSWIEADRAYLGPAFDASTKTDSGYPRVVKEWRRGTPLSEAMLVYEGKASDVAVNGFHDPTPGFERDFIVRGMTTYTNELYFRQGGTLTKIAKPDDADTNAWRQWLLIKLRTPWKVVDKTYPAGALLAARFDDFLAGKREMDVVFEPTPRTSLSHYSTTRSAVILNVLDNVRSKVVTARPGASGWAMTPMTDLPEFGSIMAHAVDELESDDYWLNVTDFLTPASYFLGDLDGKSAEKLKQAPSFFDASPIVVSQHEAVSKDGTRIPYFEVAPRDLVLNGSTPTLMTGYGGFEISETPYYDGLLGSGWLERGGVFVLANIRGGGEFGPAWHESAIKENRMRCYEDFSAVARDLIARKVASPARLGCMGGSNGGLLVGNMLSQYPDLFGAIVCRQPLLDMQRYTKLLAGASWMGEYGDPDKPQEWAYIQPFSPYHNVSKDVKYPRTLFTSSTRDDRVHPGHARKMALRMEEQGHDVLYYENIEGGHAGSADNKQQAFTSALAYTFLWKELGLSHKKDGGP
jgi:prolyl oligopeptidase